MKYILFSIIAAAATYYYLNPEGLGSDSGKNPAPEISVNPNDTNAVDTSTIQPVQQPVEPEEEDEDGAAEAPEKMVQIHGKWYKYRQDNTYMINGVPTLFIPKAAPPKEMIQTKVIAVAKAKGPVPPPAETVRPAAVAPTKNSGAQTGVKGNADQAKSQKLFDMASKSPHKVYTPEGFKLLKDGLDAAKNAQKNRAKTIEDASQ